MALDARFKRPGEIQKSAFGVQFDLDRETKADSALPPPPPVSSQPHTSLPISKHRSEFLYLVENHAVTIVAGETGSGKTTQIPLYLLESGWCSDGYQVVCTQARRAAAAQVAQRVAEQTHTQIGTTIGFCARFQDVLTPGVTQVKFTTDEALLNEIRQDPLLTAYSVVVVDEVHERSLSTDLLLALLRKIMRQRPTLRIVIASATMDVQKFFMFFSNAHPYRQGGSAQPPSAGTAADTGQQRTTPSGVPAVLSVEGRLYPVQEHFLTAPANDYLRTATNTALEIHRAEVPGDILVFVATSSEVQQCMDVMHDALQGVAIRSLSIRLQPLPLHGGLPAPQLAAIFQPTPRHTRRVIFATNMAETSLTIEGIVYVIDTLHSRQSVYDPFVDLDAQAVTPISGAAAQQRGGRAGRVRPGHCFRVCTEDAFKALKEHNVPEIQRSHLAASLLQLKALGIDNIMTFPWLDPPPAETAVRAMEQLYALGAVNEHARLTSDVGVKMSELPLAPPMAAALLNAARSGCSEEVAAVAALTSVRSIWAGSRSKAAKEARTKFAVAEGDLLTYFNVYRAWREHNKSPKWAFRHFVNHKALLRAEDIRLQLRATLKSLGEPLTSCDDDPVPICKALVAGYFLSACRYMTTTYDRMRSDDRGTNMYSPFRAAQSTSPDVVRVAIDENSVLAHVKCPWLVFASSTQASDGTWRVGDVLATDAETLAAAAPHVFDYVARKKVPDLS